MRRRLALMGPTGVGKTAYVDALLDALPLEVINMDSYQVYAFFRVGPGRADGGHGARRHLYGYLSPHARLDVEAHMASARAVADEVEVHGRIPLFEGGSRTLLPALARAMPVKMFGVQLAAAPGVREAQLRRRVDGYFVGDALVREIEAAIRLGYADTRVMRDPLVYMQTRDYLAGKLSLAALKQLIVEGMLAMQDEQMAVFSAMDVEWVSAGETAPDGLVARIRRWLVDEGWSLP